MYIMVLDDSVTHSFNVYLLSISYVPGIGNVRQSLPCWEFVSEESNDEQIN